jgi:hypothetical protein
MLPKLSTQQKILGRPALGLVSPSTKEPNSQNYKPVIMGNGRSLVATKAEKQNITAHHTMRGVQ